jgi:hypothetical protein
MKHYNKYNIKETDHFDAFDFPRVQEELEGIIAASKKNSSARKGEIIVSYLRDHSLKKDWIDNDTELTGLLKGGYFATSHIEALFECSRGNKSFLKTFEDYMRLQLA